MTDRNLESLKDFALMLCWGEIDRMLCVEFDGFLADKGLLWKTRKCPSCLNPRPVTSHTGRVGSTVRTKFECFQKVVGNPGFHL